MKSQDEVFKSLYQLSYKELLQHPKWYEKRKQILKRDGYKCINCDVKNVELNVHHRQYHEDIKSGLKVLPWQYSNRYLVTLCRQCHLEGHQQYKISKFNINK